MLISIPPGVRLRILFANSLGIGSAVRIEEVLAALLPLSLELRCRDVPVGPTFFGDDAQILAEIVHGRTTEAPVTIIDLVDDKTGLEDDHMRDHRIMARIRIFGDVEILLDNTPAVREERPMSADAAAIFVRLGDVVGADRDEAAIADLHFSVEFKKSLGLSAVLGAVSAAAEDEHHWVLALQSRELPALRGVLREFVVREDGPRNHVVSHRPLLSP
jgi:hypothetical protein